MALNFSNPTVLTFPVLGLQACTAMPSLCHAGDQTQYFVTARQVLYQLSRIPSPEHDLFQSIYT